MWPGRPATESRMIWASRVIVLWSAHSAIGSRLPRTAPQPKSELRYPGRLEYPLLLDIHAFLKAPP